MKLSRFYTLLLAVFLGLILVGHSQAQPAKIIRGGANGELVTLDFQDVELATLVKSISELTGKNFLFDNGLKGKATIISPQQMTVDEAYDLFLTVLNVKGYTVVPSGKVHKIVPTRDAKEANLPTILEETKRSFSEQYVTRLIPLKNVDAAAIASTVLQPLIPKTSSVVAYAPTNTLIVTDNGANIDRLVKIIRELDISGQLGTFEVIPLKEGSAEEIAEICNQMLSEAAQGGSTQATSSKNKRRKTAQSSSSGGKILAYERTNSLIVMASGPELITIRKWIQKLDQERNTGQSNIHVYYLRNADSETLAKTLNEILTKTPSAKSSDKKTQGSGLRTTETFIAADIPTNALIINAPPEDYEIIEGLIRDLDIQRKQVYIEALIMELSLDATKKLGSSLQGGVGIGDDNALFGASNLNEGSMSLSDMTSDGSNLLSSAVEGLLLGGLFGSVDITGADGSTITVPAFSALLELSKTSGDVNILSAPRLLTSDNEEAEIVVGANVPVVTETLTDSDSTNVTSTVERQDVALTLRFTPQITQGNLIRLQVYNELTDLDSSTIDDENGPSWTKRLIQTTVLTEDRQTVVLGGLISTEESESVTKVPLLGDIPLLGWLFKHKSTTKTKTNIMIFLTPKIISDVAELRYVTSKNRELIQRSHEGAQKLHNMLILEKEQKKKEEETETQAEERRSRKNYHYGSRNEDR